MSNHLDGTENLVVPLKECRKFIIACMKAIGTSTSHAETLADVLVEADYRGHYSHGMNRLENYIKEIKSGLCNGTATPVVVSETPATAWVDGQHTLGAVVAKFSMNIAIEKAKNVGVGWVCAKGSNHFGIAGMYTLQALKEGLLGFSFCNSAPIMNTTRSKKPAIGVNPLSFAAPSAEGDNFFLDMSTTVVAVGKIEMKKRRNEPLPEGWALDQEGRSTTDPVVALDTKHFLPLGGSELNGGYKGFGLGMMVEILSGILADGAFGCNIRTWNNPTNTEPRNLGQCFVAVDPKCFAPGFEGRLKDLLNYIRTLEPVDVDKPVLVAGDPEKMHMDRVDQVGGISYCADQLTSCDKLATLLNVAPLKYTSML